MLWEAFASLFSILVQGCFMVFHRVFILFLFCFFYCGSAWASSYVDDLVKKALDLQIYNERPWQVLLHYKKDFFGKEESLVDDKRFFLSPNGKTDSAAELEATIREIFSSSSYPNENDHPYCKFPARRKWLTERLNIDEGEFPAIYCSDYEKTKSEIDPQSITLIFPFLYINSPMSMFGHTLLRINNSYNDALLGHGVTFNAMMPEGVNLLQYSVKGLLGLYPGTYSVKKYYTTIFEYTNIDKRDIWEYDLNFTREETEDLFRHLWELADIYSDYFFLDENCSYNLLFLLEAARPSLYLSDNRIWEAPPDTVKRIYDLGLVTNVSYRPSHTKTILAISSGLPTSVFDSSIKVGKGQANKNVITESDYPDRIKAGMFDLAIEVLRYDSIAKGAETDEELQTYKEQTISLLSARSKFKVKTNYNIQKPKAPHEGHDISSLSLSGGVKNGYFYTEANFRMAFHSLYDIDHGYIENSETVAGDFTLRLNTWDGSVKLQKADIVSIKALPPMNKIFKPLSWKIQLSGRQKYFRNDGEKFVPYILGGGGISFMLFESVHTWIMAEADLSFSSGYSSYAGFGLGGSAGAAYSFEYGKLVGELFYRNYIFSRWESESGLSGAYIFPISQNNALTAKHERRLEQGNYVGETSLSWRYYF